MDDFKEPDTSNRGKTKLVQIQNIQLHDNTVAFSLDEIQFLKSFMNFDTTNVDLFIQNFYQAISTNEFPLERIPTLAKVFDLLNVNDIYEFSFDYACFHLRSEFTIYERILYLHFLKIMKEKSYFTVHTMSEDENNIYEQILKEWIDEFDEQISIDLVIFIFDEVYKLDNEYLHYYECDLDLSDEYASVIIKWLDEKYPSEKTSAQHHLLTPP